MTASLEVKIPQKLIPLFNTDKRYISIYGGRGSAKSWTVADFCLLKGYEKPLRFLCAREIQNSIKDSVHKLLVDRINHYGLDKFYNITEKAIKGTNGTEFIFKGLRHNANDIKSTEGIDICWVEESHSVSRASLTTLTPTIRKPGSQIIFTYNPTNENDPVHEDFTKAERDDVLRIEINFSDNPWFPDVLNQEMEWDKQVDYDKYLHVWEGQCIKHSEAQIFYKKWIAEEFETHPGVNFYYGADWGFSKDPAVLMRCYEHDRNLYIDHEAYGVRVDTVDLPALFDTIPEARQHMIRADNARPETISHMVNQGFKMRGVKKGPGSIIEGIQKIRNFNKIIIHPRCKHTIDEFKTYCYKVDRLTGEIGTVPEDKNNHCVDALRYALEAVAEYAIIGRY